MSVAALVLAGLIVAAGATVQGAVGLGFALVAAPLLLLLDPSLVPVPLLLLGAVHATLLATRDGRYADWPGVGWAMLGRLPGTVLGGLAVVALPQPAFTLTIGAGVLAFVLLSLLAWHPRPAPGPLLLAGVVSGAGGTAAAISGPPVALLYQRMTGPRVRGTLGCYFLLGGLTSVAALTVAGEVAAGSLRSAALLLPFLILGFLLSGPARRILDQGWTRTAVLTVTAASAVLLILRSTVGW